MISRFVLTLALFAGSVSAETFTWEERAASGAMVQGAAFTGPDGSVVESYTLNGAPLSVEAARELGIQPKAWESVADIPAALPSHVGEEKAVAALQPLAVSSPTIDATPLAASLSAFQLDGEADAAKGVLRTGMFADLAFAWTVSGEALSLGEWSTLPDGTRVASVAITSAGAVGIRVEFAQLLLPSGAYAQVYGNDSNQVFGPFDAIPAGMETLWAPTVGGGEARIEIVVPAVVSLSQVQVTVRRVVHQYLDPAALAKAAGGCNLDVTCYPTWATTALGVGGLGSIGNSGSLFCTCTLLNDNDPCTDTPYVLTANHCIRNQTQSNTLEFYWEYDTNSCNGSAPNPASVPRTTGGADFLAGSGGTGATGGGNDFTLLRLRNAPPGNLTRVGFNSAVQPLGTQVTCVHHPRGDFKRIAFGNLSNSNNIHANFYHEVTWAQGTTEPGSSGSVLMRTDTQQIIGQLWGGGASCSNLLAPDYYGRFDKTYPVIASYLNQGVKVGIAEVEYTTSEGTNPVIMIELNQPAPVGGVTVDYELVADTAQPGYDFVALSGTATFLEAETVSSFSVALINDTHFEFEETATITLSNPGPGSCVSLSPTATTATVSIIDNDIDTDGDSLSDADEVSGFYGAPTNPLLADTDGDGVNDRQEITGSRGYVTDPNVPDTDGDGIEDGLEYWYGLDPLNSNLNTVSTLPIPLFRE
jgi:hypothetical protein